MTSESSAGQLNNADPDDVPTRLVETAIRLYGERGCHAVSARQIIREAEVLNDAAIRYYFGDKQDLLKACVHTIAERLNPIMAQRWGELDAMKAEAGITVRDLVTTVISGLLELYREHRSDLQLLARMIREEGVEGQAMHLRELGQIMWRFEDELGELLAWQPSRRRRLNAILAIYSMINALVDQELLATVPAVDSEDGYFDPDPGELLEGYIDFITTGISGPVSKR